MKHIVFNQPLPGASQAAMPVFGTCSTGQALLTAASASQSIFTFNQSGGKVIDLQSVNIINKTKANSSNYYNSLTTSILSKNMQPALLLAMQAHKPQSDKHESNEMMKTQFLPMSPPYS